MYVSRAMGIGLAALSSLLAIELGRASQENREGRLARKLEQLVERTFDEQDLSGLTVIVDLGGAPLLARGWGEAAPRRSIAASVESPYRAGSLTTQFLAVAVLGLVDRERIDLDRPVGAYLPELASDERPVKVEHLLSQASGYPPLADWVAGAADSDEGLSPERVLGWLAGTPLLATPGECFVYSDTNTYVLGLLLERVSEVSVERYLEDHVFEALGMEDTVYHHEPEDLHTFAEAGQEVAGTFEGHGRAPSFFGAEALCTSARDLVRFQRALLAGGVVSDRSYERLTTARRLPDGSSTYFGLGISRTPLDGNECISYGGGLAGSRVHLAWYPAFDLTITVLADGDDVPVANLERSLARLVFELPEPEVQDLPLTPEERAVYLGDYYVGCSRISIEETEDGHLVAHAPMTPAHVLLSQGFHIFVTSHDSEVRYLFQVEKDVAVAFVLEEHGTQTPAVRMD